MSNNVNKLTNYLLEKGKTHSWAELADMFEIMKDLPKTIKNRKKKCDYVRRLYSKVTKPAIYSTESSTRLETNLIDEFKKFIQQKQTDENIEPYLTGNPNNILVIGDTHIPYNHPKYLSFCLMLQKKWNCGKVIHIGDILDFNSTSFHTNNPNSLSPYFEFEIAKLEIQKWNRAFPEMVVIMGNHDRRISRKMFDAQISEQWQVSLNSVLNVNWTFVPDYEYNNIYFCHGEGATARITALQKQMSAIQGHRHSETYIDFPAKNLFSVQLPCGVDRQQLAFEYMKADPKEWMLGACVILDSKTPIIERL